MVQRDARDRRLPPAVADIARRAGTSRAAVAYALSGRPGGGEPARRRIQAAAEELGWVPRPVRRALLGRGAGAIGFVVARPERLFGVDPFQRALASGMRAELSAHSYDLLLGEVADISEEVARYQRWHAERRVDAVFLTTLRHDDPRIEVLSDIGLPAVVYGAPDQIGELAGIWHSIDPASVMADTIAYLAALGHGRLAYVTGPPELHYVAGRIDAFTLACRRHALDRSVVLPGYHRGEDAARITERLLSRCDRPTAVIYDNDVMALAGLAVARALGLDVPASLSIVSWEDSAAVRRTDPPLASVSRDVAGRGERAAQALLALLAGELAGGMLLEPLRLVPTRSIGTPAASA